jgi:hypothetical protein
VDVWRQLANGNSPEMNLTSLLPTFVNSAINLHNVLLPVCLVLGFGGLVYKITTAHRERSLQTLWPYLVKLSVAFAALGLVQNWGPMVTGMVNDASTQAGLDQTGVLTTFANDVAKKFGANVNTSGQPATQPAQQQQTNPFQWVGNAASNTFSWFSSLGSPSAAAAQATGTLWQALSNASTGVQTAIETLFVMICCVLGMLAMWSMWLLQQVLAEVCFAVSPIFLGCILLPPMGQMAARFFTNYISVLCWPIGWGIANLVTVALLNLALNPTNNTGLGVLNFFGGGFIWWIGVGLWALFSSVAAPWLVTKALSAGEQPLISLFSAGVNTAQTSLSIATSAAAPLTGQWTAAGSIVASTMAVPKSFASRPVSSSNSSNGSSPAKRS